jgi:hypothetical protein
VVAGERDRPDVARRRAQWTKYQDRIALAAHAVPARISSRSNSAKPVKRKPDDGLRLSSSGQ